MAQQLYPRQDIPVTQKGPAFFKEMGEYAEYLLSRRRDEILKMNKLYDSYNGKSEAESIRHLVSTYGKANRTKYIPYRLSKTKMDIMVGEFLKMPLNATVRTINLNSVTENTKKYEFMLGASHANEALNTLKYQAGVDVMEGADIPDKDDPTAFQKMSFNDKNETIMQIMLNAMIGEFDLKGKFSRQVLDCTIVSRMFGQIVVNEITGDMTWKGIDPRDAIVMEYDRDPFYEHTPLMGSTTKVPINEILTSYRITGAEREKLETIRKNPNNYLTQEYRGRYSYQNGEFCADVMHLEFKTITPKYSKVTSKTNRQMLFSGGSDTYSTKINPEEYELNVEKYNGLVKSGKIKEIVTEWEEDMYELVRIGHDMYLENHCGRKKFIQRDEDTGKILGFSYRGMVFNKIDGHAVSLKEMCAPFDVIFDNIMYQALREMSKAKGKVVVYDRAGMPRNTTIKKVLYNALNDSFIDVDSSAAGNSSGKDLNINQVFKEIDLGVSSSLPILLQMKQDIINTLDMMTGINDARQGATAASSTVTNNMQNLESSRTITEPMFYYMTKYFENVMLGIVEVGKLVWGLYQPNKAKMILGDEKFNFLKVTKDIAFAAYKVELVNPRWEQQIMERMRLLAEYSLNSKELRASDVLDMELQETMADKRNMLKKAWADINAMRQQETQMQIQAQAQSQQANAQNQMQIMNQQQQAQLAGDLEKIREKGRVDIAVNTAEQKNNFVSDQASIDLQGDNLLNR